MKRLSVIVLSLLLALSMCIPVLAASDGEKVCDLAGLFSAEDKADLETQLAAASEKMGMDVVILTTAGKGGKTLQQYADDFYDNGGYGTGSDRSGLVYVIDMEDRTAYISTAGKAVRYYTDSRIYNLTDGNDQMYACLGSGDYKGAAQDVLNGILYYYDQGIESGQFNYDPTTGKTDRYRTLSVVEIIISLGIAALAGYFSVNGIKKEYSMDKDRVKAQAYKLAYRAISAFAFTAAADTLIRHNVTRRALPRVQNTGGPGTGPGGTTPGMSTIHTSGSGMTHGGGGGGRRF